MGDDADGHQLLAVVATVHHEGVCEALDDGALCLAESLLCVSAGGVGDVDWGTDLDVVAVDGAVSQNSVDCPISPALPLSRLIRNRSGS